MSKAATKTDKEREIVRARERADLARLRFSNAVSGVVDKLTPDKLRAEAIELAVDQFEQTRRDLKERFQRWPVAAGAIGAASLAGVALMFWKPARVAARWGLRLASLAWSTRDMWRNKNGRDQA